MKIIVKQFEYKIKKDVIYLLMPLMIFAGKVLRYTLMKRVLVDTSIGYDMLPLMLNGSAKFEFFSSASEQANAAGNAAFLFSFLRYFGLTTYIQYEILITIVWNILLILLLKRVKEEITVFQMLFVLASIAVLNIFDFTLAKEPIQMLYFILCFYAILKNNASNMSKYIMVALVLALSFLTYRTYYVLVLFFAVEAAAIFWMLGMFRKKKGKTGVLSIILAVVIIILTYYVILRVCRIVSPGVYQTLIRVRTRADTSTAATTMHGLFGASNLLIFCVDYMIMIIRMLFPLELVPMGLKYWMYVVYQLVITYILLVSIRQYSGLSFNRKLALYVYLGFLLASGTFEPDFGSWVRHEAVLFPIFLIMNDMIQGTVARKADIRTLSSSVGKSVTLKNNSKKTGTVLRK